LEAEPVAALAGIVVSVHAGSNDDLSKEERPSIQVELDGIVGDAHRAFSRECWSGDKQPQGTVRRNERQWSADAIGRTLVIDGIFKSSETDSWNRWRRRSAGPDQRR